MFSLSFFLSITHAPLLNPPEHVFTLLPLFLGHDRVIRPALLSELLPRVAHAPAADLLEVVKAADVRAFKQKYGLL